MDFDSYTNVVVTVAVELVNTLTPGERRGRAYAAPEGAERTAAITEILRLGDRPVRDVSPADADRLTALAERLRVVFDAMAGDDADTAAHQVNRLLAETEARPRLERHDGQPWHVHFHAADDSIAADLAADSATGLALLLGGDSRDRLGVCTAPRCDRVYVDASRNGTRRFCSTACQNRVKAASFRARHGTPTPFA